MGHDPLPRLDCSDTEDIGEKFPLVELPPSDLWAMLDPSLDGVAWKAGALEGEENSPYLDPAFGIVLDKLSDNFSALLTISKAAMW